MAKQSGSTSYRTTYLRNAPGQSTALQSITTGLGATTSVEYKPLTNSTVYTKDTSGAYPYHNIQNPTYVVSRYTVSDGLGGEHGASYKYAGAKTHLKGGGWLGFREITISDERSGGKVVTSHNQNFEAGTHGTIARSQNYLNGVLTSQTENFYSARAFLTGAYAGKQKFIQLDASLSRKHELNGAELSCAQINTTYDDFGSALSVVSKVAPSCSFANPFTKTTTATYDHDTVNWRLGRITLSKSVNEAPGVPAITRTVAYTYGANGFMTSDIVEPDSTTLRVTSSYTYDPSFGNRTKVTISGPNFTSRDPATTTYDGRGQFPLTTTNALLGHSETRVFDPKWGAVTSHTGPNGLVTTMDYDGLGRLISTTSPDGKTVTTALALCDGNDPACPVPLAKTKLTTTVTGAGSIAPSVVYLDLLGRTLRTKGTAFDNQSVYQDTEYNNLGQVARSSLPYYAGASPSQWTGYAYDAAGRVTSVTPPDGSVPTTTVYQVATGIGPKVCVTNALNQTSCVTANAAGQVIESADALNGKTVLSFDAIGNVTKVVDAKNNTVLTAVYDTRGRKTSMVDADSGAHTYNYNALGELLSETDAKAQTTSATYDLLGRIETRTNLEGTFTWTYDTAALGSTGRQAKGRLASITGPGSYATTPSYDNFGRALSQTTAIDGTNYTIATAYDTLGRPDTITYPTGFKTRNCYDSASRLIEVRDASTGADCNAGTRFWKANAYDEFGKSLSHSFGNGLTTELTYDPLTHALKTVRTGTGGAVQNLEYGFDALGNLISRLDNIQGFTETFGYDALNRLTQVAGPSPKTYAYDAIGNFTTKSDVGSYSYHATKVHAVTGTVGALNSTYTYDDNGNLQTGAGRTLTYTSFNKPKTITVNGLTSTITYGPGFERLTKTNSQGATVYLGKLYERFTQGSAITHRHYVASPAGLVAVVSQGATNNVRYLHGDHLGSTSVITDETGIVVERLSFDPHGKRRQPNGQDATQPIESSVNRGYTGHEMDDESGLINMNARGYDPVLGRFMQADVIADSFGGQGLNRYSYVLNNPLSATDPSGNRSFLKRLTSKQIFWYGPLFLYTASPDRFTATGFEHYVKVNHQEPMLMRNPKLIPVVKVVISAVIFYFTGSETAALFNGMYDARFTYLMGGDNTDQWHAFNRSYSSTLLTSYVSQAFPIETGASWESITFTVAARGVASGAAAEIQGGDFWQGYASGAGWALLDYIGLAMREGMKTQSGITDTGQQSGVSEGLNGDGFNLAGCRDGSTGLCLGGFEGNIKYFLYCSGSCLGGAIGNGPLLGGLTYSAGGFWNSVFEAFAGPHDFLNNLAYGYDAATGMASRTGIIGGDFTSILNVVIATPIAASHFLGDYNFVTTDFMVGRR